MVTLISDGGTMTVGRRTASYTWGSFDVVLPDGTEQQEDDGRLVDGYIYRPDDRGRGRGELTFVRADARIDMNAEKSDLEDTLDGASRRTEGAVFYTREISGLGLGKKIPGVDYHRGDLVDVLVWGKRITLPVTGLRRITSTDRGRYDTVQVGGQALADPDRQRKLNSDLDRQIAAEKRQRLKEAGQIRETAESAKGTAEGVEKDLHTTHVEPVEESWFPTEEGWQGATETLNKNFLDFKEFQTDTNARFQERIDEHGRLIIQLQEAKERALASMVRIVAGGPGVTLDFEEVYLRLTISGRDLTVEALGEWRGDVILNAVRNRTDTGESATGTIPSPYQLAWRIPHPEYSRERIFTIPLTGPYTEWVSAIVTAQIRPGTMVEETIPLSNIVPARDEWDLVASFTTTQAGLHTVMGVIGWDATTYRDSYGMRLVIGDRVESTGIRFRVGPPWPIGDGGYRRWVLDIQDIDLPEGAEIRLEAYAGAGGDDQRRIRNGELRIWWVDDGNAGDAPVQEPIEEEVVEP